MSWLSKILSDMLARLVEKLGAFLAALGKKLWERKRDHDHIDAETRAVDVITQEIYRLEEAIKTKKQQGLPYNEEAKRIEELEKKLRETTARIDSTPFD